MTFFGSNYFGGGSPNPYFGQLLLGNHISVIIIHPFKPPYLQLPYPFNVQAVLAARENKQISFTKPLSLVLNAGGSAAYYAIDAMPKIYNQLQRYFRPVFISSSCTVNAVFIDANGTQQTATIVFVKLPDPSLLS